MKSEDHSVQGKRIAIVQPVVPHYRQEFFVELINGAAHLGIQIDVFAGEASVLHRQRADVSDSEFSQILGTREIKVFGKSLFIKSVQEISPNVYDLVIVELAVRNIETYSLLRRFGFKRVAFWGHGKTYTKDIPRLQEKLKYWLARRGTWFFAYTQQGIDAVVAQGVDSGRTTALNNSIDTLKLRSQLASISISEMESFSERYDLRGHTAIFIGALDTYKRVPFLLDSADIAHQLNSDFRFLIAGDGADRARVERFVAARPWASYLGRIRDQEKALGLSVSQLMMVPGTVGLVALDSLVAGVPIVTTDFRFHAPEFDYLANGVTAVVSPNDVESYALSVIGLLNDSSRLQAMVSACKRESLKYSTDKMVENYLHGLTKALRIS